MLITSIPRSSYPLLTIPGKRDHPYQTSSGHHQPSSDRTTHQKRPAPTRCLLSASSLSCLLHNGCLASQLGSCLVCKSLDFSNSPNNSCFGSIFSIFIKEDSFCDPLRRVQLETAQQNARNNEKQETESVQPEFIIQPQTIPPVAMYTEYLQDQREGKKHAGISKQLGT